MAIYIKVYLVILIFGILFPVSFIYVFFSNKAVVAASPTGWFASIFLHFTLTFSFFSSFQQCRTGVLY